MTTAKQVQEAFTADLEALLKKYSSPQGKAEIEVVQGPFGSETIEVCIPGIFDEKHECVREFALFSLGGWIEAK